jgi:hypothetical protein
MTEIDIYLLGIFTGVWLAVIVAYLKKRSKLEDRSNK